MYVLDNIDWEEKAHDMRQDVQNRSVHAVATSVVFNRVPENDLPDSGPQKNIHHCNVDDLVTVNDEDINEIRARYRVIIAKLLFEHFSAFESLNRTRL